jgi:hypothetical protein
VTRAEAFALHAELEALLANGPGGITDLQRFRLKQIEAAFGIAPQADSYLREMAGTACRYLDIWLNLRRPQQWDSDRDHFRGIVINAVYKAKLAIARRFPEAGEMPDGPWR